MKEYVDREVVHRIIDSERSKEQMLAMLENTPTANVRENKPGEWIWNERCTDYTCSVCGEHFDNNTNFCPNCGADMRSTSTVSDAKGGWDGEYYLEDC